MTGKQTPVAKFKAGLVQAAVWENEVPMNGKTATMLKATVQRRFKNKEGNWQSSGSFGRNEIPLAIHCLQKCFESMLGESEGDNGSVEEEIVM